ncbi:MAG: FtsW/RodA/SpoVE family cell cycle protein [Candidatus Paceibacterota bacterium]|jgi:rod shape determining protein RodA
MIEDFRRNITHRFASFFSVDWILMCAVFLVAAAGMVTMNSFVGSNFQFEKQLLWVFIMTFFSIGISFIDFRFLRRTGVLVALFASSCVVLLVLLGFVTATKGAESWFKLGGVSFQPSDPIKVILILVLAKYFSRRHIEIANIRHILVSGVYAFIIFGLVFLQPDFGSAIIMFCIWLGMVLVSGINKKHLFAVFLIGALVFGGLWVGVFKDYQKNRIMNFIHPLADIRGTGYNAYQSTVAVGSGQILGKGVGYGTQSRLKFLPEYETDFIFAAFAEEWGYVGVMLLFVLYGVIIWRVLANAVRGATNFEILFGCGVAILFISHFLVHIGMNIGLLPVTGVTVPFMSYGGSHLLTEFGAIGLLMGMRRYSRPAHKDSARNEIVGVGA